MTFGATLGEHLTMAAFANMFYIGIDNKNKTNFPLYSGKFQGTLYELAFKEHVDHTYVKINIKLILVCLSDSFFNSFMK